MLRLTRDEGRDEAPDSYLFPAAAVRMLGKELNPQDTPLDFASCDAARQVEIALREVERRFERLKDLAGSIGGDPDRPRAA